MTGQRRRNIDYLKEKFGLAELKIAGADMPVGEIGLETRDFGY
jgi:hypothetical protein